MKDFTDGMSFDMAAKVLNDNIIELLETSNIPIGMGFYIMNNITTQLGAQYDMILKQEEGGMNNGTINDNECD